VVLWSLANSAELGRAGLENSPTPGCDFYSSPRFQLLKAFFGLRDKFSQTLFNLAIFHLPQNHVFAASLSAHIV
jgi:hypothetical protein